MPIYEYRCNSCGHELERLQRISEAPLTDCPECAKPELRRLISPVGFRLKGGGWYETDFKKDGKRNVAEASADAGKADAKADASKPSESKPAEGARADSKPASDKSGKAESTKASAA